MIRPAEPRDEDAVLALARDFVTSFMVDEAIFRQSFAELLAAPNTHFLVAEVEGRVAGYLLGFDHRTFFANGRVAWVEEITVESSCRRQGIGRQLMEAFEDWARTRNARLIALATRRAASFYQSLGYEESAAYFRKTLGARSNI